MHYIVTFSLVIFLTSYFPELPNSISLLLLFFCSGLCLYRRNYFLLSITLGILIGSLHGVLIVSNQLPEALVNKEVVVEGVVTELPIQAGSKTRFILTVDSAQLKSPQSNHYVLIKNATHTLKGKKIQLSWYRSRWDKTNNSNEGAAFYSSQTKPVLPKSAPPTIIPSQRWRLTVKLKRPRGLVNPAGFDYQAYLLREGIAATGYVRSQQANQLLEQAVWYAPIDYVRWRIQQKLLELSYNKQLGSKQPYNSMAVAPLIALAIGDTQWITPEQWQLLKNTGTIHLLAISGLHIGLAAAIGFFVGRLLMCTLAVCYPLGLFQLAIPPLFSILLASTYSLLAGMSLPTQRALFMVVVFHVSGLLYSRVSAFNLLVGALCVIAVTDPLAVYSQGFWLSFLAVAVLIYGFYGRNTQVAWSVSKATPRSVSQTALTGKHVKILYSVFSLIKAQWLATAGLFVPSIIWLQGISISAPLANIFAVSWVSLLVVPLIFFFLAVTALFAVFMMPDAILEVLYTGLEWLLIGLLDVLNIIELNTLSFWYPAIHSLSSVTVFLGAIVVMIILLPRGLLTTIQKWGLALICLLPSFYAITSPPILRMTVLDVGQGTAVVIETPSGSLVYDTGRAFSPRFDIGQHVLAPYLRSIGIHRLDTLVVSHKDGDHAGGVNGLLRHISVDQVLYGQEIPLSDTVAHHKQCLAGQQWQWDSVQFSVLWPSKAALTQQQNNNNLSCVIVIESMGQRILLAGDIETSVEKQLLDHPLLAQGVDILLVPHHGSQTSSSQAWVRQLSPEWAIVSSGYKNHYGHPHPKVKMRYEALSSGWMNTADQGAIRWTLSLSSLSLSNKQPAKWQEGGIREIGSQEAVWEVESWRRNYAHYWFDR